MNRYHQYKWKELWADEPWEPRKSQIIPLAHWIGEWNLEQERIPARPEAERNTEGKLDAKANALINPEIVNYWEARGLHFHCTKMGRDGWVAMVPVDHMGRKGYDDAMDTIVVLLNADQSDPNWYAYLLDQYRGYLEAAIENRFALHFIVSNTFDSEDEYISIIQEAIIIFHFNFNRYYLDVSSVGRAGRKLSEIPGFHYTQEDGQTPADPDAAMEDRYGIPVLNITNRWLNKTSLNHMLVMGSVYGNLGFDRQTFLDSDVAKRFAEGMSLEYLYDDARDPELMARWDAMGLQCDFHDKDGEQWITFVPKQALEEGTRLPCMCIFQEVNAFDPHQAVTAFAYCHTFHELAAQGEFMILYFVLEDADSNDLLHEILKEAEQMYPVDRSRIYITGHSHDGRFALEYMRRHTDEIAAIATLGNEPGLINPKYTGGFFRVTDEQIALQASVDIPLINICGMNERNCMFPLYTDAPDVRPGDHIALCTVDRRIDSWQRRLRAMRCPMKTDEEIMATKDSDDVVIRTLGIPADRTMMVRMDCSDNYIADMRNVDGKWHFRIVALGNMPHTITPAMVQFAWSFVRRFAKNPETGECVELY